VSARAWELGELLDWAVARAASAGFVSVTVADGSPVAGAGSAGRGAGLALVCVQPLLVYRAREGEDLTFEALLRWPIAGAGDWSGDCAWHGLGLRWFPVPAGGDLGRGPLVPAVGAVLPGCRGAAGRARCHR
jgi:hypothetical protein